MRFDTFVEAMPPMLILFPSDPLDPARVDSDFERERDAAREVGLKHRLVDLEALAAGEPTRAVRRVAIEPEARTAVYRGWTLTPARYAALFEALKSRGVVLVDTPDGYRTRLHLVDGGE